MTGWEGLRFSENSEAEIFALDSVDFLNLCADNSNYVALIVLGFFIGFKHLWCNDPC